MGALEPEAKETLYTADFKNQIGDFDAADFLKIWFARADQTGGIVDATMFADQQTYLPNDLLVKVDIASMANSLEARSPLLDHKVIEFAASLPENLKMRGFETKSLLKKVGAKLVPPEVIYRRKMGFGVPLGSWFRGALKDFVKQTLLTEQFERRGIVRRRYVENLIEEHLQSKQDHGWKLWVLIMLELWFQEFID